jgi:hypothetical protein
VKGLLLNLRSGANSQAVPDFTIIPKLPLDNADKLEELENWLTTDANLNLLVSIHGYSAFGDF